MRSGVASSTGLVAHLGERAIARKLRSCRDSVRSDPKNQPVLRFLQSLSADVEDRPDGSKVFRMTESARRSWSSRPMRTPTRRSSLKETDSGLPAVAGAGTPPWRLASEGWEEIASDLSMIGNLLRRIDDRRLRPRPSMQKPFVAPRNDAERMLARLWADALGLDGVGIHDDFFELGGTSLQATLLANALQQALQRRFDGGIVFEAPTVAALSDRIGTTGQETEQELRPVRRDGTSRHVAPASSAQRRLWFLDQFDPGHPVYNERRGIRLQGRINVSELKQAVAALYARHESLRTTFSIIDGQPVQIVGDAEFPGLEIHDLAILPARQIEAEADRLPHGAGGPVV